MEPWHRLLAVGGVIVLAAVAAKLVDRRMARRELPPEAVTRYRVLRRSLMTAIFAVGILFAALAVPQVRTIAGVDGVVEEIGLTYTFIRTVDNTRLVIPNEKLASDTIRNSTIVSREKLAEITVQVPLDRDLDAVVNLLRTEMAGEPRAEVLVTSLNGAATVTVRAWAPDDEAAERLEADLRARAHRRLRTQGLL